MKSSNIAESSNGRTEGSGSSNLGSTPNTATYTHDQLIKALYWIWDAFDRAMMGMFLVYETAEQVLHNKPLEGDSIHVGTRRLEWVSGSKDILTAFTDEPIETNGTVMKFEYNQVPVCVHIFEDDPCISSPDQVFYKAEYFKVPNPYSKFLELYPKHE